MDRQLHLLLARAGGRARTIQFGTPTQHLQGQQGSFHRIYLPTQPGHLEQAASCLHRHPTHLHKQQAQHTVSTLPRTNDQIQFSPERDSPDIQSAPGHVHDDEIQVQP